MYLYRSRSMTLNRNLCIKLNRINHSWLRLILRIQASVVLPVDTLKKLTAIKRYICLTVKIVAINLMMTALMTKVVEAVAEDTGYKSNDDCIGAMNLYRMLTTTVWE